MSTCAVSRTSALCWLELVGEPVLLVTAFEPFGGETVNASWEAARRIDGRRCGEAVVVARKLPCAYDLSVSDFVELFERLSPNAVLLTGQAARRGIVSVERFARNAASATARDNHGALGAPIAGPALLETTASASAVRHAILEAGVAARISTDAGGYVCNHLYYRALLYLAAARPKTPAIFIHLPATPAQTPPRASRRRLDSLAAARALEAALSALSGKACGAPSAAA